MKRFDTLAVKARLIERLQMKQEWARLLSDGTISSVFDVVAEGINENSRYLEYLLGESKWENAQNMSSLTHMAALIGRKRRRQVSATGYVVVSHSDEEGTNRLQDYGSYFFSLDQSSNYDDMTRNNNATIVEQHALVPWTYADTYVVPKYTSFVSTSGIEFFSTTSVRSRQLKEPFSAIKRNQQKYDEFVLQGGWDGIKYLKVPIIQGVLKRTTIGRTRGARFETFVLSSESVEDASNSISEKFFAVIINDERWVEVPSISLAGPYDKVFEATVTGSGELAFKFGDGVSGAMPPKNVVVWVEYVETLGAKGNVTTTGSITKIQLPDGFSQVDPRTNVQGQFLFCSNVVPLMGGGDAENEETFKRDAPSSYLESYTIGTTKAYEKAIRRNSPIGLLKLKMFNKRNTKTELVSNTDDENLLMNVTRSQSSLVMTAVKHDGTKIEDPETSFLEPLVQALADNKGPTDFFEFVQPNFVKVACGVTIKSSDLETSDDDVKNYVKASILDAYAIQNTDFETPLYHSTVVERASCFPFSDSVNVFLEAVANTDYDGANLYSTGNIETNFTSTVQTAYVAVPFQFDEVYGFTKGKSGFMNYKQAAQYLLRVEVRMPNLQVSRDRVLMLFDQRSNTSEIDVESAKDISVPGKPAPTLKTSVSNNSTNFIKLYNERSNSFVDRVVRVAQFQWFDTVCSDANMYAIHDFSRAPYELRPLVVDQTGQNKEFTTIDVPSDLREPIIEGATIGQNCFKKDNNYYEGFDVIFYENYDKAGTIDFAHGFVVLPMKYLGFGNALASLENYSSALDVLPILLKDNVSIEVFARPLINDIELDDPEDIAFVDSDHIRIERLSIV